MTDREKIKEALEDLIEFYDHYAPHKFKDPNLDRYRAALLLASQAATKPAGGVMVGDIILFNAVSGHPVYGEEQEFIGRVQKDAKGLYAANYYQHAWKNMRVIEAITRKENGENG